MEKYTNLIEQQLQNLTQSDTTGLVKYMVDQLKPRFIDRPLQEKMNLCKQRFSQGTKQTYSAEFLEEFESTALFNSCKSLLNGIPHWSEWSPCPLRVWSTKF